MAFLEGLGKRTNVGVVWSIEGGLRPGATCAIQSEAGQTVTLRLDPDEFARLWSDLATDPRFKIGGRNPKPDQKLDEKLSDLLGRVGL